jgi:hypothetical protein
MKVRWVAAIIVWLAVAGGCAAILDIPDRTPSLCTRETHDICEDFDNPAAGYVWNGPDGSPDGPVTHTLVPSEESAPNALSIAYGAVDAEASATALYGSTFERSPNGLRVAFDVRVDDLGLLPGEDISTDAQPIRSSSMTICIVQWNSGGIAITLFEDGAYLAHGPRLPNAPTAQFRKSLLLAPRADVVGKWNHVTFGILLDVTPPRVEVRFGARPSVNPELDPSVTNLQVTTDVLYAGGLFGPSGPSTITFDNLQADFAKPVAP